MKIPMSWLREFANPNVSDKKLISCLTMTGSEVEGITYQNENFKKIVVGKIITCTSDKNSNKLNICTIDVGDKENLSVVCGAKNVKANMYVAVAKIGAKLDNGLKIKKAKFNNIESFGVICSKSELGLENLSSEIFELTNNPCIGDNIANYLNLNDSIIDLNITPNRGDCFSILGIAREICANYNLSLKIPNYIQKSNTKDKVNLSIKNSKYCPKYLTLIIKNIDNSITTPKWITDKLIKCGERPHSLIVDITNFVMLELGQPMHAFDLSKIAGNITVRMAKSKEKIQLLNEQNIELKEDTLIIADDSNALAIAGIMGGIQSSVQTNTKDILLESAFFNPVMIANKARNYSLHTESSLRFERGVDFNITKIALYRAAELIIKICGGKVGQINEFEDKSFLPKLEKITIYKKEIKRILGFELDDKWIEEKFNKLEFKIIEKSKDFWKIIPPSFRFDIRIDRDLIEELARLYGYDKLPLQNLYLRSKISAYSNSFIEKNTILQTLVNNGYQEVINYSFISQEHQSLISALDKKIIISNPISENMSIMRSSLWAGLLQSVHHNQRRGHNNARFFESGLCFKGFDQEQQIEKIAGIITGNRFDNQWSSKSREVDFYDIKADVETLLSLTKKDFSFSPDTHIALQKGQTAQVFLSGKEIGWIGKLSPELENKFSVAKSYLFELDLASIQQRKIAKYSKFSVYQKVTRDIALIIDKKIMISDLIESIKNLKQEYLLDINLFDIYTGKNIENNKKSVAISLSYQSNDKTLSDDIINAKVLEILNFMKTKYLAIQR
jgi:phenylalanyl-tRNA synthetase beta chain